MPYVLVSASFGPSRRSGRRNLTPHDAMLRQDHAPGGSSSMATTESSVASLKQHIGRRLVSTDVVHPGPANLLRLTLGRADPALEVGDPLPPGWHHLYFLPRFGPEELRPDGSPRDTGVVPPMPLPRRMFAGQHTRFHRPIRIGDSIRRETELTDVALNGLDWPARVHDRRGSRVHTGGVGARGRAPRRLPRRGEGRNAEHRAPTRA